jgi:hypothetical protein
MPKVLSIRDPSSEVKLSHVEFVYEMIRKLRKPKYKGIHVVYSRFNEMFREYYPGEDPRTVEDDLASKGLVVVHPARGGAMI